MLDLKLVNHLSDDFCSCKPDESVLLPRGTECFLGRFGTDAHLHVFELHDAQWDEFNIHAVIVEAERGILVFVVQGLNVDGQSILDNEIPLEQVSNQPVQFMTSNQDTFENALRVIWILKMSHTWRESL